MKVFVVGGSGALGRRVTRLLVEAGHDVRATARTEGARADIRALGAEPTHVDIYGAEDLGRAVVGQDAVVRLTTKIPQLTRMRRATAWRETGRLRNNSARKLVDACIASGVGTYVHESIAFIYADGGAAWLDEEAPVDVDTAIPLRDALSGESHAHRFIEHGGRGIVLRYAGFYAADSLQSIAMAGMARRQRMAIIGRSANYFSSIHTDDAAAATVASLAAPAGVYNVADDEPVSLREYMEAMARAADAPALPTYPRLIGPLALGITWRYLRRSLRVSARRLRDTTGWRPVFSNARDGWRRIGEEWAREEVLEARAPHRFGGMVR